MAHSSRRNRRYVQLGRRELVLRLDIFELRDLSKFENYQNMCRLIAVQRHWFQCELPKQMD